MSIPYELKKAIDTLLEAYSEESPDRSLILWRVGQLREVYEPVKDKL